MTKRILDYVLPKFVTFLLCLLGFLHGHSQAGAWRGQNYYQVWTDSVTDITDWEATIHGHFSMINNINIPYGISWTPIINPSISYNTTPNRLPVETPSGLPYNSPSQSGTGIQLNQPTTSTVQNIPFSIKLTGLSSGTRYYFVTRIHSSYGSRTYLSSLKNFVTTHNGSHYSAKDSLQWLIDTATQYFDVGTEIPLATSNSTAEIKAYYLENFSWSHPPKHVGNMWYGPMVVYKSTNPNILSEVIAGNYFDHHTKEVDYWSFSPGKGPTNASTASVTGLNPNQKYYFTSSLFFEFIHRTSVYGGYASGINFRRFSTVDSMNCQTDSIKVWLKDTADSYFDIKVLAPNYRTDSNVSLGAVFSDNKLFPNASSVIPLKYGPMILYLGTSRNLIQECKDSSYFDTHTPGIDYWLLDSIPSASDSIFKIIAVLDTSKHFYYTASVQFEFNRGISGPYARELSTISYRLFSDLDSLMKHNPISNNVIMSGNQVLCEVKDKGAVQPSKIMASVPSGASGSYQYKWQHSYDKVSWQSAGTATGGDNSPYQQNFTPSSYWTDEASTTYYRRVVTSAEYSDISEPIAVKVFPPHTNEIIVIEERPAPKGQISLNASFSPVHGKGTFQWWKWVWNVHGGRWQTMPNETSANLLAPTPSDSDFYKVQIGYDPQCDQFESKTIGITKPDGDGNFYPWVKVGSQNWMMSNLRTSKYNNGNSLEFSTGYSNWSNGIAQKKKMYSWYQNDSLNYALKYGALYSWYAVNDSNNVCPNGWHVPTETDWLTLSYYLGGVNNTNPAYFLKSAGNAWKSDNSAPKNSYNFSALPAGKINHLGEFNGLYYSGNWWADKDAKGNQWTSGVPASIFLMESNTSEFYQLKFGNGNPNSEVKGLGSSIRCIKDYAE